MTHRTLFPPPDERRALEQLERLHREIQRARRERERAGAEFEGFVQELRTPPDPAGRPASTEPASRRAQRPIVPAASPRPADSAPPAAAPVAPAGAVSPTQPAPTPPSSERQPSGKITTLPRARGIRRGFILPLAATVLIGGLAFVYFWQRTHAPAAPPPTESSTPASPAPPPASEARPAPAPPPSPVVSPSAVQLTTGRNVWLRVTVDGQRVLERELPAGQQLTYTPASSIVIRAGDAGAVRVKVGNGPDEPLGRDAFPATRRFTVRPSTAEPRE